MLTPELASKLRKKDRFPWTLVPWISFNTITAIGDFVYVPPKFLDELLNHPNPHHIAILHHEFVHIERQKDAGLFKWLALYLLSNKFRIEEELAADKARLEYLAKNNESFDIEQRAKQLSSWLYLHVISYEEAKKSLEDLWNGVRLNCTSRSIL